MAGKTLNFKTIFKGFSEVFLCFSNFIFGKALLAVANLPRRQYVRNPTAALSTHTLIKNS